MMKNQLSTDFIKNHKPNILFSTNKTYHNIFCLSDVCTFAVTSACDWSSGTHVSQLSQSKAEVAEKYIRRLNNKHCEL